MLIRITEKNKPNQIRKNVIVIFARAQLTPVLEWEWHLFDIEAWG